MENCCISRFISFVTLILSFIGVVPGVYAIPGFPESELIWKNVTVNGRKTAVFTLFKDTRGLMWLGTNNGLFMYDGVTTYPIGEQILAGTQIYSIVEIDGRLLLGSNNGLLIYDYNSGNVCQSSCPTPKEIRTLVLIDDDLWIGGLNGISRLNLRTDSITEQSDGLPHRSVYSIMRDSRGILYAGTYSGLARWNPRSNTFTPLDIIVDGVRQPALFANCLLETDDLGCIYVGGEGALYSYSPVNDRWKSIKIVEGNNIKCLASGYDGSILVGTDNGVFELYGDVARHSRHDSRQELSLADNEIWCIYADSSHNVWTGHERGISLASVSTVIRSVKLSSFARSGEGNEIYSIYRDSHGDMWFTGTNGAIRLSRDARSHWYRRSTSGQHSISHNRIRAITEDRDGRIWFATDAGVNRYDRQNDSFEVYHVVDSAGGHRSNWVYALIEDGDHIWVGSFLNGLHYVDKSKFVAKNGTVVSDISINTDYRDLAGETLANNLVNDVVRDNRGNLWILLFRDNVLTKYDTDTGGLTRYDIQELVGGYPTHICLDSSGRVWCAFRGGVIVFADDGTYTVVGFPYTNSDETILSMGKVGDDMWVSTLSNVWRIDGVGLTASLLPIPQKSYTAVYEDTVTNSVYLGGADEIMVVERKAIGNASDYKTIKMVLNDRGRGMLDLSDIKSGASGIKIPYGGSFSLVVGTLEYSPQLVQRYMYKLSESPSDTVDGWVVMPEGANTITLSDLKMGDYHVLVKAVGAPEAPVSVPLTVAPPFLLSPLAIILYVLIVLAAICWIIWYMRRKSRLALREQERQAALDNVERKLSFLSDISHDLKTPLSMIIGPVSIMKERAKDPESRRNLETVYDNAVRLNNMIHRTLELQHIEDTDENLLIWSTFDAVEFCRGVFEVFRENNSQKKFIFHTTCKRILVEADAVKFESVIANLLSNACKYSDDGATISCGIRITGKRVEIAVSDDGVGISDADQPLVFQRMFRSPAISKLREGTGLGLYLIKRYLDAMHGTIDLYSKEGQGTSFVVSLPVSEKEIKDEPAVHVGDSSSPRILIVEDNIQIAGFISDILKNEYTCFVAENGRSGLAMAASFIPDLIIVDEMMPIMNGLEMVRRLKKYPRLASVPIIMLTAKCDNKTETDSIKAGIDTFMTKPFEPTALIGRIGLLLKGRCEIKETMRIQALAEAESRPIEAESVNEKLLARIVKVIEDNIADSDLNVGQLCEKSGIPNKQLYRLVKKYMGVSPLDYIRNVRLQKAAVLLSQHRFTVSEISYMVGFKTPSYFAKCFQNQYGVKPSQYRSDDESVGNRLQN